MTHTITIEGIHDFVPDHIFECGQCFRWNLEGDCYVGVANGYVAAILWNPSLDCACQGTLVIETTGGDEAFWRHYLDLDTDYGKIKETIIAKEPEIEKACDCGAGIRILNQDMFETLISFVVSQNNNIPRIKKCIESICEHYGESLGNVFGRERFAFPTPEVLAQTSVCELADLKLGYRSEYIVASAKKFLEDGVPTTYDEVLSYHGIGPKVANCIMLFGLHKVDAFPIDTWVKHIMNDMYGFDEKDVKGMAAFAEEKWGSYAGYAQQYLFDYYRNAKFTQSLDK